ncbi:hypothetical protein NE634_19260, partial [Lacrimispora saccharolytica]|nr:hypothetical protein [Lacrimispora saccharolytica]
FAIMIMGYAIVKSGIVKSSDSKILSAIIVYLVTQCMIINSFQIDDTPEVQNGLILACAAATAVHMFFFADNSSDAQDLWAGRDRACNSDLYQCGNHQDSR